MSCRASSPRCTTSEARPLRGAGRLPRRRRGRREEGVPPARARAAPGREHATTPRPRRSSRRPPRRTRSSSDAERRATYDRYGFDGLDSRGFASAAHGFGSFADIFDAFFGGDPFGAFGGRGATGRVQGGDVGVEVQISLEQAARGADRPGRLRPGRRLRALRRQPRRAGLGSCTSARNCQGAGRVRAVSRTAFGQLVREQVCEACGGEGRVPSKPCTACSGRGRKAVRKTLDVDVPGRHRRRAAHPPERARPRRRARRAAGRPLRARPRRAEDERFVRDGSDLVTRGRRCRRPPRRSGTTVSVPTLDGEEQHRRAGRHPAGHRGDAARQAGCPRSAGAAGATSRWC